MINLKIVGGRGRVRTVMKLSTTMKLELPYENDSTSERVILNKNDETK